MNLLRKLFYTVLYLRRPPWDTGITPPELMALIAARPPGRALDLGCGTGTNAITLARSGWQATGVDFIPKAASAARRKAKTAGVSVDFYTADVTRLPAEILREAYDLVLDIGCFHSLDAPGKERYLEQLPRLLNTGGTYLLYGFVRQEQAGGVGLNAADLRALDACLERIDRQDGYDHDRITSAWLTYTTCPNHP